MTGSDQIAQLAITLDTVKPPVRRRIEVPLAIRLDRLHRVFQIVMGWEDYHLYEFRIGRDIAYGVADRDWDFPDRARARRTRQPWPTCSARPATRRSSTSTTSVKIGAHGQAEALAVPEPQTTYPRLLAAKGHCPPEDVGGPWGYAEYLAAIADPKHERHAEMVDWRGPEFDPSAVDEASIQKQLDRLAPRRKTKTLTSP